MDVVRRQCEVMHKDDSDWYDAGDRYDADRDTDRDTTDWTLDRTRMTIRVMGMMRVNLPRVIRIGDCYLPRTPTSQNDSYPSTTMEPMWRRLSLLQMVVTMGEVYTVLQCD